ncbi:diguanylate cyclase [Stieleria sp. ICT_E10.1]|uniref:sensor domain-containing diguanylate cyclase/phosphohydrolase n=1 Tax=Stieleria sedimenti TaxID=2976331 RepID=UPI00218046DD|nr:diguanylate cyclase [Stieleria sedimenti]MCS7471365.1 diguanylate cyclase [Stieleria sedimenti]
MTHSPTPIEPQTSTFNADVPAAGGVPNSSMVARGAANCVTNLLAKLQIASEAVSESPAERPEKDAENRLAVVRLGIATSLFYALRTKHPATAAHGLRVALFCSSWAEQMGLDHDVRDRIEVGALLHDVGKIGIPDRILRKPGKLTVDEQLVMDTCPDLGCDILQGCTTDPDLLDIVRYCNLWYDSRRDGETPQGEALPLGARMLAIADAFDAMTTEHVYRPAMSRDRAIAELVRGSGTQFDPDLVLDFSRLLESRPEILQGSMVHRWLQQLRPEDSQAFWTGTANPAVGKSHRTKEVVRRETLFNQRLLSTLKDGVAFTDGEGNVSQWNVAMERLTDLPAEAIIGKQWSAAALRMRDTDRDRDDETICPLQECFRTGESVRRAMIIEAVGTDPVSVHVEVAPVHGERPGSHGTVIVVHDLSDREHLERRLDTLHQQTRLDGLTRVANRAHFDTTLEELVAATAAGGPTFALVICDLDHFKRINDTFGHPAGDEALKVFANVLRSQSREGDLVARYGGEEFLLLANACDNATGAKRAEVLRQTLESTPIEALGGECITASFGVTEYQSGDSAETVLARADRALLKAKDNGRNRVVQLGLGKMSEVAEPAHRVGWFEWLIGSDDAVATKVDILTPVPADLVIEKLRGFIADHHAEIVNVAENQLSLKVVSGSSPGGRRRIDHKISFHAVLTLSEAQKDELLTENATPGCSTKVHLELKPIRNRDRRRRELNDAVQQLIASFRCYLMGEIINRGE